MLNKRKCAMYLLSISATILIISGLFLIYRYFSLSVPHYINYTEDSNLKYKVMYKDNNFFNDEVQNNKYIASLIDYIKANFKYNISFSDKNINYNYKYKIIANVRVLDNEDKEKIYEENEVIFESENLIGNGAANISKSINIDYNKYNDLINNFKNTYGLKDADSKLEVSMHIELNSNGNSDVDGFNKKAVVSLSMPLTKRTTGIDISNELTKSKDRKILIKGTKNYFSTLFIGIIETTIFHIFQGFYFFGRKCFHWSVNDFCQHSTLMVAKTIDIVFCFTFTNIVVDGISCIFRILYVLR